MLKIEFDPSNTVIALAIGKALIEIGGGAPVVKATASNGAEITEFNAAIDAAIDGGATSEAQALAEKEFNATVMQDVGKSASVAGQDTTAAQTATQSDGAGSVTTGKPTHDEKGVAFIPAICANAAKPFYASGPYKGQWKKGTKVDQAEYDRVYAISLGMVAQNTATTQTSVGEQIQNSPASKVFEQTQTGSPIDETINEIPATPAEVFALYGEICAMNGAGAANVICQAHGLDNGTLIFSAPELATVLFRELTTQKNALVGAG